MNLVIHKLKKEHWDEVYAKNAHEAVFAETYNPASSRADFALLVVRKDLDEPVLYATVQEVNGLSVTLEYGGSFPNHRGSPITFKAYEAILDMLRESYEQAYMMIRNDNRSMLKFALKKGFLVTGVSVGAQGALLLEHTLNLKEKVEDTHVTSSNGSA
jgi:hypothetical protein